MNTPSNPKISNALPTSSNPRRHVRFYSTKTFRLVTMLALTFSFFAVELVVGNITNSLALTADAFHMLSDVISLLIGLLAVRIVKRRSNMNTYGWVRAEVVGANINSVFLLALCLTIIFDTIKRYIEPEPIVNVNLLLIVGSVGLGINIVGLFLFQGFHGHTHGGGTHGHSHHAADKSISIEIPMSSSEMEENVTTVQNNHSAVTTNNHDIEPLETMAGSSELKRHSFRALEEAIGDCTDDNHSHNHLPPNECATDSNTKKVAHKKTSSMNMHGVFLHVLADALGSVVVIISSLIIKFVPHRTDDRKHWTVYVDPTLSVLIVIIITISAIPLLKESTFILLQTVPRHIDVRSIKKQLLDRVPEIDGIHELHIWRLSSNAIIASAHLHRRSLNNYMKVADKVKRFFHTIGIHSTTIQYEYQDVESQACLATNNNESEKSKSSQTDCLLSCMDDACDTQTCCTKDSIRTNAMLNASNSNGEQNRAMMVPVISTVVIDERSHSCNSCDHAHNAGSNKGFSHESV